mmetsp:Transcript_2661/g.4474  ORF Transcript_2661/g.4474 Transcript_2661/m.4474 type:complete len:89 (-) Transcript_2661:1679-1945(-)
MKKYATNYAFYEKDEFGDDDTPVRERKRCCYQCLTVFLLIVDFVVQFSLYNALYLVYFFATQEEFNSLFFFFGFGSKKEDPQQAGQKI